MEWINVVQRALQYIEKNLLNDIDAEDIANYVFVSSFHFQKIFRIVTGFTITEYIKNRKLSLSGEELYREKTKITDAAFKYGYQTSEGFTRAFTRFHGITPSTATNSNAGLKRFNALNIKLNVEGGFEMKRKMISKIPVKLIERMNQGQNYWFNGHMEFLMECLGESKDYDYWFFAGVTGDSFTQLYSEKPEVMALCYSHNFLGGVLDKAFNACGYEYEYISSISHGTRAEYDMKIRSYIDKDIPVIARIDQGNNVYMIICGYDDDNLYFAAGEENEPQTFGYSELIFIGERKEKPALADVYRSAVNDLPSLIAMPPRDGFSFGRQAFVDWAESFQNGKFGGVHTHGDSSFNCWNVHGTYLCMLGSNQYCVNFLRKALELNPDMAVINELIPPFEKQTTAFNELAGMEGGFGISPETIMDNERMKPISEFILKLASYSDDILNAY